MNTLDSRFRGNDRCLSHFVIPAKAGIHVRYPYLLSCYPTNVLISLKESKLIESITDLLNNWKALQHLQL